MPTQSTILIVEDEYLIALDLEQCLTDLGYDQIVIVTSCKGASIWLASHTPAAAILDVSLKDGPCTPLAHTLVERKVPFIVSSGLPMSTADPVFSNGYSLPKPFQQENLKEALEVLKLHPAGDLSALAS